MKWQHLQYFGEIGILSVCPDILDYMDQTKLCNGFYIQFRQNFAKETFS